MALYDLTLSLSQELVVWKKDKPIDIRRVGRLASGHNCNLSVMTMSVHAGTHVDAPRHFLADGKSVDALDLQAFMGPAQVLDVQGHQVITKSVLETSRIDMTVKRIVLLTDNTERGILHGSSFTEDFVAVDETGAKWLVEAGFQLVGIDALSVAPFVSPVPTHRTLLGAEVVIVEGLDLSGIEPGIYQLYVFPMKIKDCDGAPARVVLEDM